MALPSDIPLVPPVTAAGFADPIWPRWLRLVRAKLSSAITELEVASHNGLSGTVSRDSASLASLALGTTASGVLKGSSGSIVSAVPGVDYTTPASYISAISTANQSAAANTRTAVTLTTVTLSRNFTQPTSSAVQAAVAGVYNLQFSVQLVNPSTTADDVYLWAVLNGSDLPATNSICTVPSKHGSTDGSAILAANIFVQLSPRDRVELYWATTTGTSTLKSVTPTTITAPLSPSVILTLTQVFP